MGYTTYVAWVFGENILQQLHWNRSDEGELWWKHVEYMDDKRLYVNNQQDGHQEEFKMSRYEIESDHLLWCDVYVKGYTAYGNRVVKVNMKMEGEWEGWKDITLTDTNDWGVVRFYTLYEGHYGDAINIRMKSTNPGIWNQIHVGCVVVHIRHGELDTLDAVGMENYPLLGHEHGMRVSWEDDIEGRSVYKVDLQYTSHIPGTWQTIDTGFGADEEIFTDQLLAGYYRARVRPQNYQQNGAWTYSNILYYPTSP